MRSLLVLLAALVALALAAPALNHEDKPVLDARIIEIVNNDVRTRASHF